MDPHAVEIEAFREEDRAACATILAGLEPWFGIPEATRGYLEGLGPDGTLVARWEGRLVGFVQLVHHTRQASEIHVMAVGPQVHRRGVGRALVEAAAVSARRRGSLLLQVKTLSARHPSPEYARTRAFYRALGFVPLQELPELWGPSNPALQLVRPLMSGWGVGGFAREES